MVEASGALFEKLYIAPIGGGHDEGKGRQNGSEKETRRNVVYALQP
jgi:hypothetical protein